jgi:transposase InsO family protein
VTPAGEGEPGRTDQGSPFTRVLRDVEVPIQMDDKGRWMDHVFIERLWCSIQYGKVYLHAYADPTEGRQGPARAGSVLPFFATNTGHIRDSIIGVRMRRTSSFTG